MVGLALVTQPDAVRRSGPRPPSAERSTTQPSQETGSTSHDPDVGDDHAGTPGDAIANEHGVTPSDGMIAQHMNGARRRCIAVPATHML